MIRRWEKLGRLYCPPALGRHPKLLTHAANPLPVFLEGNTYRIFYSARDSSNRSSIGAVDVDLLRAKVVRDYEEPWFEHGPPGSFYADGVSIGNCYQVQGRRYMLFMGWQASAHEHWRGDIGRLEVRADLTLSLDGGAPFLGSDPIDPVSLSYPWVMGSDQEGYRMWYGSTMSWDAGNGEMLHVLKYATSSDGHCWQRQGLAVPYELGVAQAFSRPTVIRDDTDGYQMWFSYRGGPGRTYRIGYACSADGLAWQLALDQAGIDVSADGWDSEMVEYPFVLTHAGRRYMLYNGNGHGRSGFGLAVLTET